MRKNNKKIKLVRILLLFAVVVALALILSLKFLDKKRGGVVAKVNGDKIYKSEVDKRLREIFQGDASSIKLEKLPPLVIESLAKDIYTQKKIDRRIKKAKIIKKKEIKEKIEDYEKKLTREEYFKSAIKDSVSDEAIKNKYAELVDELSGKREVRLQHIAVRSKDEAELVLAKIKAGNSFEKLAQKYSAKSNSDAGALELGYVLEDDLTQEFADFVAPVKKGVVSKPIQIGDSWHILKIVEIRNAEIVPFESVKATIEEQLKNEQIAKIFSDITKNAKVKIMINLEKPSGDSGVVGNGITKQGINNGEKNNQGPARIK